MREWWDGLKRIQRQTRGIEWWVGIPLYGLKLLLLTQWLHIVFGRLPSWVTDLYVVVVLALSFSIFYWCPNVPLAWVSAYFSGSILLVLLNVVLLRNVFGDIESPERTLLLFMCNLAQIVFMYATWYHLEGPYAQGEALRKSMLVLATIGYPDKTPTIAELQIATNFILLAIFLGQLAGRVGTPKLSCPVNCFGRHGRGSPWTRGRPQPAC
jgi:hypothetical protein